MNQARSRVLAAILELARELPPAMVDALAVELETSARGVNGIDLTRFGMSRTAKEQISKFTDLLAVTPELDGRAVALAIQA
jgi:hypothetical protein